MINILRRVNRKILDSKRNPRCFIESIISNTLVKIGTKFLLIIFIVKTIRILYQNPEIHKATTQLDDLVTVDGI